MVFRTVYARLFDVNGTPFGSSNPCLPSHRDSRCIRRWRVVSRSTTAPPKSNTPTSAGPTAIGTASAQALAANPNRVRYILQNSGIYPIFVLHGAGSAGPSSYTYILHSSGVLRDGWSGLREDSTFTGAVQWACPSNGGLGVITEETQV